ncbi:MAG: HAD-IA family hydrolase [Candidatus Kerfeldbacteria bacterium]|nr:HAD-IA family hydrolase [Candidatus Kerfeldbacteria bacterium]
MITSVLFDMDGMVVLLDEIFSDRLSRDYDVPMAKILPFFENEFQDCLVGRADLKHELAKYTARWGWEKSVDDLVVYWFQTQSTRDERMIESVQRLRARGIRCSIQTNNERYRVEHLAKTLGLRDVFDDIFASYDLGCAKPSQEFWRLIHDRLGQPTKTEMLVWDDDPENVESARRFGFHAELYTDVDSYSQKMGTSTR